MMCVCEIICPIYNSKISTYCLQRCSKATLEHRWFCLQEAKCDGIYKCSVKHSSCNDSLDSA